MLEKEHFYRTFDRCKLIDCCKKLVQCGKIYPYPGRHSVRIMDGASIHCDPNIVYCLLSLEIRVIYLPAYCPFFNPIEFVFGVIKSHLQRNYIENGSLGEMKMFLSKLFNTFEFKNMYKMFKKCGYLGKGSFDPSHVFCQDSTIWVLDQIYDE